MKIKRVGKKVWLKEIEHNYLLECSFDEATDFEEFEAKVIIEILNKQTAWKFKIWKEEESKMTLGAGSFPEPPEPKENDNQYIIDLLEIELKKFYDVAHKLDKSWYDTIYKSYIDNDLETDQLEASNDDVDVVIEVRRTIQKLEEETR